jgi:hypothetical protein
MRLLHNLKQVFIPVNQPTNFPRLYFLPETKILNTLQQASNDPAFHQILPTRIRPHQGSFIRRCIYQLQARALQACGDIWMELKAVGRAMVRWLAWRLVLPLSVACSLWIPVVNPAELPL